MRDSCFRRTAEPVAATAEHTAEATDSVAAVAALVANFEAAIGIDATAVVGHVVALVPNFEAATGSSAKEAVATAIAATSVVDAEMDLPGS